ncbi:MAG: hypothetical protein WC954_01035 [Sphaerochaeta sp.]
MVNILNDLNEMGYSNALMERILGLPARTLARWKNEQSINPSAAAIALMRIIRTYPWILVVADAKFDEEVALNTLIREYFSRLPTVSTIGIQSQST